MYALILALLLAAWLIQPWSHIDIPSQAPLTSRYIATSTQPLLGHDPDIQSIKATRSQTPPQTPPSPTPALTPSPTPAPSPSPWAPAPTPAIQIPSDGLEALICSYPWPCQEAIAVARCESGTDSSGRLDGVWASSRTGYGLFQINPIHIYRFRDFWESWMDPVKNTEWAFQLWSEQGWRPWACRPR